MISIQEILNHIEHQDFYGSTDAIINNIVAISSGDLTTSNMAWCGEKYKEQTTHINSGTVLVNQVTNEYAKKNNTEYNQINWIIVENPRRAFAEVLNAFFVKQAPMGVIEPSAAVHDSVQLDQSQSYIGKNVVIEENCKVGKNVSIGHNTVILSGTVLGDGVKIGSNCTIGGVGFGYEMGEDGQYRVIPHIGNVEIGNDVEIGNNVCIDRAVLGSTKLHDNVKVDNLVHIAHGVEVGKNSLVIAKAMVAGSVKIGENVWVAPMSSIIQKTTIGDNSLIGMGSTVLKDVEPSTIVAGSPAKKIRNK